MLGWYDRAVESFLKQHGEDVWEGALAQAAGQESVPWLSYGPPAADTAALALFCSAAQSRMLDTTPHQLLEDFGEYFVRYLAEQGYSNLLKAVGTSLLEFLQNLNDLHLRLGLLFPTMAVPAFKCTDVGPTCLTLHYHSHRPALGPIVVGVFKGLAEHYWGLGGGQLQVDLVRGRDEGSEDENDDVFRVSYPHQEALRRWQPPVFSGRHQAVSTTRPAAFPAASAVVEEGALVAGDQATAAAAARSFTLSPDSFYQLFPFHLLLDRSCRVVQAGAVLERLFPELCGQSGAVLLEEIFLMRAPSTTISYESLRAGLDDTVLLRARGTGLDLKGQVLLVRLPSGGLPRSQAARGECPPPPHAAPADQAGGVQLHQQGEEEGLLFLGSPWLAGLDGMRQHGIYISDIPRHDSTRDFVMLAEQRNAETQLKDRLEALTLELKEANSRMGEMTGWLDEERRRSDGLLYQMLPPEVASCLKHGDRAPAQEHKEATVLFSDIVGFTEIASRSSPLEVCSLLDELYQRFDAAIEEYPQLYKVETIGDAYMVVCNVTVPCDDHADVLLEFALRMHEEASQVASSLGEPVRIRVGMHSGPVVAGVVGRKMPRFCLFGDSVNTASRMESHGEAGKIHISEACYSCLRAKERFLIRERGNITIKGKGGMRTYLLSPSEQLPAGNMGSPFRPPPLRLHVSFSRGSSPDPRITAQESMPTSFLENLLRDSRSNGARMNDIAATGFSPHRATQPAMLPTDESTSMWPRTMDGWEPAPLSSTVGTVSAVASSAIASSPLAGAEPWAAGGGPISCPLLAPASTPERVLAVGREGRAAAHISRLVMHVPATPQSDASSVVRPGQSSSSGGQPASSTSCSLLGCVSPPGGATAASKVTTYLDVPAEMLTFINNARCARSAGGRLAAAGCWSGGGGVQVMSALPSPRSPRTACTARHTQSLSATPPPAGLRAASSTSSAPDAKLPPSLTATQSCQMH